jgi:CRISPR-associated endonuclease/helicase Cas3
VWAVRQWLRGKVATDIADIEGVPAEAQERPERAARRSLLCWRGTDNSKVLDSADIRPGMTLVVPSVYGGCDRWGWNPESPYPVRDVGDAVKWSVGKPLLRLNAGLAETWKYAELASVLRTCENGKEVKRLLSDWREAEA